MRWLKAPLLALPFAMAATLNILMWAYDYHRWPGAYVFRYVFLFALPWARLLGEMPIPNPRSHILQVLLGYGLALWIPATLYCVCVWIVLRIVQGWINLFHLSDGDGLPAKKTES